MEEPSGEEYELHFVRLHAFASYVACPSKRGAGSPLSGARGRIVRDHPKVTPATTFGNWVSPFSRQLFAAAITSLNTISLAEVGESAPLVPPSGAAPVAKTLSMGFVVQK